MVKLALTIIFITATYTYSSVGQGVGSTSAKVCHELPEKNFSYEVLKSAADKYKVKSVEEVLCLLPKKFRRNYAIGTGSRSFQQSSLTDPRIILFDKQDPAKFILTFNGDPSQQGYNNIEIMKRAKKHTGQIVEFIDWDFSKRHLQVADNNPKKCLVCHGDPTNPSYPARPIFNAMPTWPGFIGSPRGFPRTEDTPDELLGIFSASQKHLNIFRAHAKENSRYKFLVDLDKKVADPVASSSPLSEYLGDSLGEANTNLTIALANLNHKRVMRFIVESPFYDKYKYALFGSLVCEDSTELKTPIESFLPPNIRNWHDNESALGEELQDKSVFQDSDFTDLAKLKNSFDPHVAAYTIESTAGFLKEEWQKHPNLHGKFLLDGEIKQAQYSADSTQASGLRYLLEGRHSPVSMLDWSIDVDLGMYRFNNIPEADFDLTKLASNFYKYDRDFKNLLPHWKAGDQSSQHREDCRKLADASRKALATFTPPSSPVNNLISTRAIVGSKCLRCHGDNGDAAPRLYFDRPDKLVAQMSEGAHWVSSELCRRLTLPEGDRDKMPMIGTLSSEERTRVLAYFRELDPGYSWPQKCK